MQKEIKQKEKTIKDLNQKVQEILEKQAKKDALSNKSPYRRNSVNQSMTDRKSSLKPTKTVTYDDSIIEVNEVLEKSDKFEKIMDRIENFENYRTPQKLPSIN